MMHCYGKAAKCLLIFFNIVLMLSGAAVLGVGIWLRVDPNVVQMQKLVEVDSDTQYLAIASYIFIGIGGFILVVGMLGCGIGLADSKTLLTMYVVLLFIIFLGELAAGILALVFRTKVMDNIKDDLLKGLQKEYRPGRTTYTEPWDFVQAKMECCGVNNFLDYRNAFSNSISCKDNVPKSCCKLKDNNPDNIIPLDETKCQEEAKSGTAREFLQSKGCYEAVKDKIDKFNMIMAGVGIGLAAIEVLGIILACCVCRRIPK